VWLLANDHALEAIDQRPSAAASHGGPGIGQSGRNELKAIERSKALVRRKELYEGLHPETARGTAGGKASGESRAGTRTTDNMSVVPSFAADTAAKTGMTERNVRRDVAIVGVSLTPTQKGVN